MFGHGEYMNIMHLNKPTVYSVGVSELSLHSTVIEEFRVFCLMHLRAFDVFK